MAENAVEPTPDRVRFHDGQRLFDTDFTTEQAYHLDHVRDLARSLGVTGVVDGLRVGVEGEDVVVAPGTAVDRRGRTLRLHEPVTIRPHDLPPRSGSIRLGYREERVTPAETGTDTGSETRLRERPRVVVRGPQNELHGPEPRAVTTDPDDEVTVATFDRQGGPVVVRSLSPSSGLAVGTRSGYPLRLTTGGRARLTVDPDGNVAVGTAQDPAPATDERAVEIHSPAHSRLSVRTVTGKVEGRVVANDPPPTSDRTRTDYADQGMYVGTNTAHPLVLITGNQPRLTVDANGHLGIGTPTRTVANEGWDRAVDILGPTNSTLSVRTTTGAIHGRVASHSSGWAGGPAGMFLGTQSEHPLTLMTNRVARLTVDKDGTISIVESASVAGELWARGGVTVWVPPNATQEKGSWSKMTVGGGGAVNTGTAGGPPAAPSDARLKTAVEPLPDAVAAVRRLTGLRFRWNDDGLAHLTRDVGAEMVPGPGQTEQDVERGRAERRRAAAAELDRPHVGLLAQDVEAVLPELVTEDDLGYKKLRYAELTALLVQAVKEQQDAIDALRDELAGVRVDA